MGSATLNKSYENVVARCVKLYRPEVIEGGWGVGGQSGTGTAPAPGPWPIGFLTIWPSEQSS